MHEETEGLRTGVNAERLHMVERLKVSSKRKEMRRK